MSVINDDPAELNLIELNEYSFTVHIRSISLVLALCPCIKHLWWNVSSYQTRIALLASLLMTKTVLGPGNVGSRCVSLWPASQYWLSVGEGVGRLVQCVALRGWPFSSSLYIVQIPSCLKEQWSFTSHRRSPCIFHTAKHEGTPWCQHFSKTLVKG